MSAELDQIVQLGDDAMSSQFACVFPSGIPGGGDARRISLRINENIDTPAKSTIRYEKWHKGQKLPMLGGAEEDEKEVQFNVTLDQQWGVYDDLKAWKELGWNSTTSTPGFSSASRTTMIIQHFDRDDNVIKSLKFLFTAIYSIKITEFNNQSGDPLKLELGFIFARREEV